MLEAARGNWSESESALKRAKAEANRLGLPRASAMIERSIGDIEYSRAAKKGKPGSDASWKRAVNAYRRGAKAFEEGAYVLEAALTREQLARVFEKMSEDELAQAEMRTASLLRCKAPQVEHS